MKRKTFLALALACSLLPFAHAGDDASRLERIRQTGTIVIAHGETGTPFSYVGPNGPTGFGADVALRIADAVKVKLGLKELQVKWNPMTLATRFPLMTTQTVDLECSTTTHTRAREELVAFSNTYYISEEALAVPVSSTAASFNDLAGKRIAVTRNTTTEKSLASRGIAGSVVAERNNRRAMAALLEGRADAFVAAQAIIAGELIRSGAGQKVRLFPSGGAREAFACMLPKGDAAFKQVADETIANLMKSGEMARLYDKWFMQPVPPFKRSANLPLDEANKALYAQPNDLPLE